MLKKKLMSLGIAVVFTLSSLTTSVFAADFKMPAKSASVTVKVTKPGKGNAYGQIKKEYEKKYKFKDCLDIAWALNAIEKLAGKGIINGYGNNLFGPRNKVTHVEALAMVMRLTGDDKEAESKKDKEHPLYKGIKSPWGMGYIFVAIEKGILLPEELRSFNPNQPAKRHEIAKYIIRAMGMTDEALKHMDEDLPFKDSKDIPEKSVGYVYLVNELNIMIGDNNNKFNPMQPVTRAEMAVLLDRAEGRFDLPDTDKRKSGIVFVSADVDDNEITVKANGNTITYDVVEGVQVYKNDSFGTIEDLVEGDVLRLTLNDDKDVIFIEVLKEADDNEDDETKLTVTNVVYSNLPNVLLDEFNDLKSTENYKAYEYDGNIYLFATMGKKNTGGYDIDITDVYKVQEGNEYSIKAVVETDEPSSSSFVNQVVTYPYSIVKFKSFDNIENVVFVDEDDDQLEVAEIEVINEVSTVEGEIYDIISGSRTIKIEKSNGEKVSYTVPTSAEIIVNGDDDAEFADLEEGMAVEVEITDGKVTKVTARYNDEDKVSFRTVNYNDLSTILKEQVDYLKLNKNFKAYEYDGYIYLIGTLGKRNSSGYKIEINDLYKVEDGDKYLVKAVVETETPTSSSSTTTYYPYSIVKFKQFDNIEAVRFVDKNNNKIAEVKVVELNEAVTVEGTISGINSSTKTIKVQKSNGSGVSLTIPDDAEIIINGDEDKSFSDLVKGMKVEIEMFDNKVTKIIAEDTLSEVKGTLTGISISTEKKITLKVGSANKTYTVGSNVKVFIDGEEARVEDLRVNDELTLKFVNGLLVEIDAQ